MFLIEDNEMTVTKGDTAIFNFSLKDYTLTSGDSVYFTVKQNIEDTLNVMQKLINTFSNGVAKFTLTTTDTNLTPGTYVYDIQVNLADGRVDTVIPPSKFKVTKGVTN